ncbi:DNA-3-methyladenine glycosylase 2 family protein [Herbiconiux sp. VKM Ac-1786]|uniref:DNA-3-methyladenine glycosylase family protein n=1 Tax=Herbiconiux sp. VKM Ac-1786 TaxID=2783824 RepID=UPI00188B75D9|nr:DNA-3-methyladenine glycosylase 2 family protein [Herbiconiux sp. VKM Ac-1786]
MNDLAGRGAAYAALAAAEPAFGALIERFGPVDPFEFHDGGRTAESNFAAMSLHIISQQISTKVALVVYDRLATAAGGTPTPAAVLALGHDTLRSFGMSNAKAAYVGDLAARVNSGDLAIDALDHWGDEQAKAALLSVRGVGPWSAEMFLIHQLHRPDVLPAGDLGIRNAVAALDGLDAVPTIDQTRQRGEAWAPLRTYASALLWRSLG